MIGMANGRATRGAGGLLTIGLVFAVVLGIVLPAAAQTPAISATGSVNIKQTLASKSNKAFQFTVTNTTAAPDLLGSAAANINWVEISPPFTRIQSVSASAPSGWTARLTTGTNKRAIFESTGTGLARSSNVTFTVVGDVVASDKDRVGDWSAFVSNDGGTASSVLISNAGTSAVQTNVRVLQVLPGSFGILSPAGAADDSDNNGIPEVTSTQSGVCSRFRVLNHGSQTLAAVEPFISGSGATASSVRLAVPGAPCSGPVLPDADGDGKGEVSIDSNGFAEVDLELAFGSPGTANLTAQAGSDSPVASTPTSTGPADDTFVASLQATIQAIAQLSYVANSLTPRALQPDTDNVTFRLSVNKGPSNSPAITLSGSETTFDFVGCEEGIRTLTSGISIAAGQVNNLLFEYASCNIKGSSLLDDGNYNVTALYRFTDANDFALPSQASISVGNTIRIDSLIPVIEDLRITTPANAVDANQPGALKDGAAWTVSGSVKDRNPQSGLLEACTNCTLNSAEIVEFDADGNETIREPLPGCTVSGSGALSCSVTRTFQPTTLFTQVDVDVRDGSIGQDGLGLKSAKTPTNRVDVDNIAPFVQSVELIANPASGVRNMVIVTFSERWVDYPGLTKPTPERQARDYAVTCDLEADGDDHAEKDNPVTTAMIQQGGAGGQNAKATLVLLHECTADSGGSVQYQPFPGVAGQLANPRVIDRVSLSLQDYARGILERIPPLAPVISAVDGLGAQDSKFWFNDAFKVTLADQESDGRHAVQPEYRLEIFEEMDSPADGPQADELICEADAAGATVDVNCTVGGDDGFQGLTPVTDDGGYRESAIYARAVDENGNPGVFTAVGDATDGVTEAIFALDVNRPDIEDVTVANTTVTVSLNEPLPRGRNAVSDWQLNGIKNEEGYAINVGSMSGSGTTRTLTISDSRYTAVNTVVTDTRYEFQGSPTATDANLKRYEDRAGNELIDQTFGMV